LKYVSIEKLQTTDRPNITFHVTECWCSGDDKSSSVENELKTTKVIGRKVKIERAAMVQSRQNKRGNSDNRNDVIETAPDSSDMTNTGNR
jgi:hypothetical protein